MIYKQAHKFEHRITYGSHPTIKNILISKTQKNGRTKLEALYMPLRIRDVFCTCKAMNYVSVINEATSTKLML